jgi:hypothetical protein
MEAVREVAVLAEQRALEEDNIRKTLNIVANIITITVLRERESETSMNCVWLEN